MHFRNPANGHEIETGPLSNFVGALLFGPLFYLVNGLWGAFMLLWCLLWLGFWTGGLMLPPALLFWVLVPLGAHNMVCERYLRRGWAKVEPLRKQAGPKPPAPAAHHPPARQGGACEAFQVSDSVYCPRCDLTWDMNDPFPPGCGLTEAIA